MSKLSTEGRNALMSARAKNRKAATVLQNAMQAGDVEIPKHVADKMAALEDWFTKQITPAKAKKAA